VNAPKGAAPAPRHKGVADPVQANKHRFGDQRKAETTAEKAGESSRVAERRRAANRHRPAHPGAADSDHGSSAQKPGLIIFRPAPIGLLLPPCCQRIGDRACTGSEFATRVLGIDMNTAPWSGASSLLDGNHPAAQCEEASRAMNERKRTSRRDERGFFNFNARTDDCKGCRYQAGPAQQTGGCQKTV